MKKTILLLPVIATFASVIGCSSVNVTKTAQGSYSPTNPSNVQILKTVPQGKYVEVGSVAVNGFKITDTARMNDTLRAKAALIGADAVVLNNEGITPEAGQMKLWGTGFALKYQ